MLTNAPITGSRQYWVWVDGYWNSYTQQHTWKYSDRPASDPAKLYFDTVEHNLNMAVYYCARALNYVITYGGYTDCGCSGENPPPGGETPPVGDDVKDKEGIKLALDETQALMIFSFVGLAASMLALTLQKFLVKLIEKGIPLKYL